MRTAEEILHVHWKKINDVRHIEMLLSGNEEDAILEAMKAYAMQECEKLKQDIANQSVEMLYDRDNLSKEQAKGLILRNFQVCYAVSKQSILQTHIELT